MKVVLWEYLSMWQILLWDGENTYWTEQMIASGGYKPLSPLLKGSKFTIIGDL